MFVGRLREQNEFVELLQRTIGSRHFIIFTGEAGIGKSFLISRLRDLTKKDNINSFFLDFDEISVDEVERTLREQAALMGFGLYANTPEPSLYDLPLFSELIMKPAGLADSTNNSGTNLQLVQSANFVNELNLEQRIIIFLDLALIPLNQIRKIHATFLDNLYGNILVVIASRHQKITDFPFNNEQYSNIKLSPLSVEEMSHYYSDNKLRDFETLELINNITHGFPFLMAEFINFAGPDEDNFTKFFSNANRSIIERYFEEIESYPLKELVRLVSITRYFNLELLEQLSKRQNLREMLDDLLDCSFVKKQGSWFYLSNQLRRALVSEWQENLPRRFITLNKQILSYYKSSSIAFGKEFSQRVSLEIVYHQLCIDEQVGLKAAVNLFEQSEILLQKNLCRDILMVLVEFPFRKTSILDWLDLLNAAMMRLNYEWNDSKSLYEELLSNATSLRIKALAYSGLAKTTQETGDWTNAKSISRQAIETLRRLDDNQSAINMLLLTAKLSIHQHRWDEALFQLNRALKFAGGDKNTLSEFQIEYALADLFRAQGLWEKASYHLDKAMLRAEDLDSEILRANVWDGLGKLHRIRFSWGMSTSCYQRSVNLRMKTNDELGQAICLHSLGVVYLRSDQLERAKGPLEESLEIKKNIGDNFGIAKSFNSLGHVARLEGDLTTAINYYKRSLDMFNKINNETKASRVMCRIGMTLASQNMVDEAITYLNMSRDTRLRTADRQGVAESLFELGVLHEKRGDLPTAKESFALSAKFAEESSSFTRQLAPTVHLTVIYYTEGDRQKGTELLENSRKIAEKSKQYRLLARIYSERGDDEVKAGRLSTAFLCYAEAVYTAIHEDDYVALDLVDAILKHLDKVKEYQGVETAWDFAKRLLLYWQTHCQVPEQQSELWSSLQSLDFDPTSNVNKASYNRLETILQNFNSALKKGI